MCTPPLDFSFKDLNNLGAVMSKEPTEGRHPLIKNSDGKYLTRSMRLSYNNMADTVGLGLVLNYFLAEPSNLGWLDLSFNKLPYIDECICELRELRVLYLHSNKIGTLTEVDKLGELQYLHTITLHGNIIETTRDYRSRVILTLPHLKSMDFSAVTPDEKALVKFRCKCPQNGKKSRG